MEKAANLLSIAGGVLFAGSIFFKSFFYTVDAGHRAIIFDKGFGGVKETIIGEGMHLYLPFMQVSSYKSI